MAEYTPNQKIRVAHDELVSLQHAYLKRHGWEFTCNTPGSYWLWRRDFADEDAARHARWKERGPGPLGWPSEPRPFGIITANTELAISMTERVLDNDIDQDGDPATPVITDEDLADDS
ncbi:hypothetical protein ACRQ5Q_22620 [Bradyrhizobium sp. PMVTL-01]|uniref:hypothetical protein n=1 Tax=Bradyrhizobium sp. PMVTL-01 TaxID=3434999 RepID=UPI003F727CF2